MSRLALDENDVMAITTRFLAENAPWFSEDKIKFSQTDNVPVGADELTTIGSYMTCSHYSFHKMCRPKNEICVAIHTPADELRRYERFAQKYFETMAKYFPPLLKYFDSDFEEAKLIVAKYRSTAGGHILFPPIGLRIFTEIVGELVKE
ncbi:MAG: hypothetical protein JWO91_3724 [Acidobacteriaceae bacterium]|nr:hypothetical protein [Acidobacteriaceae bacterium]